MAKRRSGKQTAICVPTSSGAAPGGSRVVSGTMRASSSPASDRLCIQPSITGFATRQTSVRSPALARWPVATCNDSTGTEISSSTAKRAARSQSARRVPIRRTREIETSVPGTMIVTSSDRDGTSPGRISVTPPDPISAKRHGSPADGSRAAKRRAIRNPSEPWKHETQSRFRHARRAPDTM